MTMNTRYLLLAATIVTGGVGVAMAQTAATYDPAQLPAIQGKVAGYSLTPRGDVDGVLLTDGTEVHLPPHLGTQLVFAVKPGDSVTIRGLKARAVPMVQAMSITNDASGTAVVDDGGRRGGPRGREAAAQPISVSGQVKSQLHGREGELNGVVLQDGTIVRLPPREAQRMAAQLAVGSTVFARGEGYAGPLGKVIGARMLGPNEAQAVAVAGGPGPDGPRPDGGRHGGRHGRGGPGAPPPPPAGDQAAPAPAAPAPAAPR
jgi:hypothetical protein